MEGPGTSEVQRIHRDAIPLLCSIFLANQGAGEAAEEGRLLLSVSICILIFFFSSVYFKIWYVFLIFIRIRHKLDTLCDMDIGELSNSHPLRFD